MCTAVTYKTGDHYFGRNLDLEYSYNEAVTITPRNFCFHFREMENLKTHYAMIGMAYVKDDYPLYYDATNEKGLSMAGLNFPGNADYKPYMEEKDNVTPFELIPWILGKCADVSEARNLLERINLLNQNFSEELSLSPLHWIISDREKSITLESVKEGLKIYENPIGILTNNPPFNYQLSNLNNYQHLTREEPKDLIPYSRGVGAVGLPGDLSSMSRFVRAAFIKQNSVSGDAEMESVSQFFHILKAVEMQRGCVHIGNGIYEITIYSSCCNTNKGIYYYTTYDNSRICAVDMYQENLEGEQLISYSLVNEQGIYFQNR